MTANPRNPALSDIGDGAMPEGMEGLLKQLVWEDVDEICTRCVAPVFGGKMIVVEISPGSGEYSAGIDLGGLCFRLIQDAYDDNGFRYSAPKNFGSIDAAKAAAQADYTARVLSAVDPDEITRLRAALADAQAVGFAVGVEAAKTAVSLNAWKYGGDDAYSVGMDVGARQQNEQDLAAIRALTPPDLTAAAARVLLDDMDKSAVDHPDAVARWGKANEAMGRDAGAWRALMTGLLAIAGDTP